jgi:hypothetical protein
VIDAMKILDLIKNEIKVAGEKQIGGNFGSICIIPCHSRRWLTYSLLKAESENSTFVAICHIPGNDYLCYYALH